jgi:hypothetical protein
MYYLKPHTQIFVTVQELNRYDDHRKSDRTPTIHAAPRKAVFRGLRWTEKDRRCHASGRITRSLYSYRDRGFQDVPDSELAWMEKVAGADSRAAMLEF